MNWRELLVVVGITALLPAQRVMGHSDVVLEVNAGRLVTVSDVTGLEVRVFEGNLGGQGIPGFTNDPGFVSESLAPNSLVGYNVVDSLLFWDGTQFTTPPEDESLEMQALGVTVTTVTGDSGYQAGVDIGQADGSGSLHQHIDYWVKHPTFDPGDPFNNPISDGAYLLQLEMTSSVHDTSLPFAILFNNNLSTEDFEVAFAAAEALFDGPCPGDFNGDNRVDLDDLATLLSHYGVAGGATYADGDFDGDGDVDLNDLAGFLGRYGEEC